MKERPGTERDVLALVLRAIAEVPARGRYGKDNVFISTLWNRVGRQIGMSLEQFKRWLVDQNRSQHLVLARADLVDDMDPQLVESSEINHLGAQFHFVLDPARYRRRELGELVDLPPPRPPSKTPSTTGDQMASKTRREPARRTKIESDVARIVAQGTLYNPGGDGGGGRRPHHDQAATRGSVVLPHPRTSSRCTKCGKFHTLAEHRRHTSEAKERPAKTSSGKTSTRKRPVAKRTPVALPPPATPATLSPVLPVLDDAGLARIVLDAVVGMPGSGRFGDKVFISEIWDRAGRETGMSEDQFKRWLVRANRDGRLVLARADLVGAMDPNKVSRSEIQDRGATFHFVLDPRW